MLPAPDGLGVADDSRGNGDPAREGSCEETGDVLNLIFVLEVSVSEPLPAPTKDELRILSLVGSLGAEMCSFFVFFRLDVSVPLASDKFGDPGRLSFLRETSASLSMPEVFSLRPLGVVAPDGGAANFFGSDPSCPFWAFCFSSSSRSRSRSSSESVCQDVSTRFHSCPAILTESEYSESLPKL